MRVLAFRKRLSYLRNERRMLAVSEALQSGFKVKTLFGSEIQVEKYLAEGGQGEVYVADYNGEKKALKWYKKSGLGKIRRHFMKTLSKMLCAALPAPNSFGP